MNVKKYPVDKEKIIIPDGTREWYGWYLIDKKEMKKKCGMKKKSKEE